MNVINLIGRIYLDSKSPLLIKSLVLYRQLLEQVEYLSLRIPYWEMNDFKFEGKRYWLIGKIFGKEVYLKKWIRRKKDQERVDLLKLKISREAEGGLPYV